MQLMERSSFINQWHLSLDNIYLFQINLIAPPSYVVTTQTLERAEGLDKLKEALDVIKETIEKAQGQFTITMQVGYVRGQVRSCEQIMS